MTAEVLESPERRPVPRWVLVLGAVVAVVVAAAAVVVARRPEPVPPPPPPPILPGWPAAGSRAGDEALRATAWRGWAERDVSVRLEQAAMIDAEDWPEATRSVVVLAMPYPDHTTIAVLLVDGDRARRFTTRTLGDHERFVTEQVEVDGHRAVVVVAPDVRRVAVSQATVGGPRADVVTVPANGGALVPVAPHHTATRVVLRAEHGTVIADRVPGADHDPQHAPAPLIRREEVVYDGSLIQFRTDGAGLTCEVHLPGEEGGPTQANCEIEGGPPL
jgi:hypothetical protein